MNKGALFAVSLAGVLALAAAEGHTAHSQWDKPAAYELYFPNASDCSDVTTALHLRTYVLGECAMTGPNRYVMAECAAMVPSVMEYTTSDCSGAGTARANPDQCSAGFSKVYCEAPVGLSGDWFYRVEGYATNGEGDAVDCYAAPFRLASKSGECVEKFLGSGSYEQITCRSTRGFDVRRSCDAGCTTCTDEIEQGVTNEVVCPFRDPLTTPQPPPNSGGCVSWTAASSVNRGLVEPCVGNDPNPACSDDGCTAETEWAAACTACKDTWDAVGDDLFALAGTSDALTEDQCSPLKTAGDAYASCMGAAGCCAEYDCDVDVGETPPAIIKSVCPSLALTRIPPCSAESSASRAGLSVLAVLAGAACAALSL
mmetsp:Transcript_24794/g.58945  ORF Transcript_24794/g.58945 Transcript_24794/m.58945 type:complete len:370 (-) Transcript_24794:123-1232(-)